MPRLVAGLGIVWLVVAACAGWFGYRDFARDREFENVDLTRGQLPKSTRVIMTGIAQTGYILEAPHTQAGATSYRYIPLTASSWRRGEPLVYFLKTEATAYSPLAGGQALEFSHQTFPFEMTTQKAILRAGLPPQIAETYRKYTIPVASPPMVLDLNIRTDMALSLLTPAFIVAGVGALFGMSCLLIAAAATIGQRRQPELTRP